MNFLQSTNFLRIWVCNLSVPLVTSGDMTSGALRRNNLVEEASQYRTGWISTLKLSFPPLKSPARIIFILIIKLRIHCNHRIVSEVLDIMFYVSWCQFSSYLNNVCHSFPLNSCNVQCSVMRKTIKIFTFLTPIMSGAVWYPLPLLEPLWAPRLLSMETIRAANGNRICLCEFSALLQWGYSLEYITLNNAQFFGQKINGVIISG